MGVAVWFWSPTTTSTPTRSPNSWPSKSCPEVSTRRNPAFRRWLTVERHGAEARLLILQEMRHEPAYFDARSTPGCGRTAGGGGDSGLRRRANLPARHELP